MTLAPIIQTLLDRGVRMPDPAQVWVDEQVLPERIGSDVTLHPGTRLEGASISIGPGSVIGQEQPAVLRDCQLGHQVAFKGGYAEQAVLLDAAEMGSGAHIRPGTLLEEQASGAHSVGFKQTILFPCVTAGSLINFCDCLMAGGTSRKNHSEIGSSYVHFNFTPHGDKATPSLIGDVPRGVLFNQPPIFLGGQGGLVGPVRVAYGVIIAAGVIQRKDALQPERLYMGSAPPRTAMPLHFPLGRYAAIDRLIRNNLIYIGNIRALQVWYQQVRTHTMQTDPYREACRQGALRQLDLVLQERIKRLGEVADRMPDSIRRIRAEEQAAGAEEWMTRQQRFADHWPAMQEALAQGTGEARHNSENRDLFLRHWEQGDAAHHTEALHALPAAASAAATAWLQAMVDQSAGLWT